MIYRCGACGKDFEVLSPGDYLCPHCKASVRIPGGPALFAWERRKELGFFKAFGLTLKESLFDPNRFFATVPPEGGYGSPIFYGMICITLGMIFSLIYQFLFQGVGLLLQLLMNTPRQEVLLGAGVTGVIIAVVLLSSPVASFIHLFLYSAIYHVFLWIVGGNKKGFEATFRAFAFSQGSQVLQIVPFLGGLATLVWQYILLIIGFKKLHQTTTGKAVAAAFLPLVLICGFTILIVAGVIALIAYLVSSGHHPRI